MFWSSSSRRMTCSCGIFFSSASQTTTARVDRRQHRAHVVDEFDRAGAIEEGVAVAHEIGGGDVDLDAHLVMRALPAGVADRGACFDRALALIAPVRARIASSSVVLPLGNGPTSAMHRGPDFLVPLGPEPFCPMPTSLSGREWTFFPALYHSIVSGDGGTGKGGDGPAADLRPGPQFKRGNAGGDVEAGLPGDRQGLQRDGAVGAANQHVGAEADRDSRLRRRAGINAGERTQGRSRWSAHKPPTPSGPPRSRRYRGRIS